MAAFAGAAERGLGTSQIPALHQQAAQVERRCGSASFVRLPVGRLCFGVLAPLLQQDSKIEGGQRVAALIRAPRELISPS